MGFESRYKYRAMFHVNTHTFIHTYINMAASILIYRYCNNLTVFGIFVSSSLSLFSNNNVVKAQNRVIDNCVELYLF